MELEYLVDSLKWIIEPSLCRFCWVFKRYLNIFKYSIHQFRIIFTQYARLFSAQSLERISWALLYGNIIDYNLQEKLLACRKLASDFLNWS